MPCYLEYLVLMWSTVDRSYMEEPGSKASVRSRDGIQGNVLLYIGFYNNSGILLCVCMTLISGHDNPTAWLLTHFLMCTLTI